MDSRCPKCVGDLPSRLLDRIAFCPVTGCWIWTGTWTRKGYGLICLKGGRDKRSMAHRVVYEALRGPIQEGLQLDHLCRNRLCVNPAHLEPVVCRENLLRGEGHASMNAAKTHCVHGHPFNEANTHHTVENGKHKRRCRACSANWWRRRNEERGVSHAG